MNDDVLKDLLRRVTALERTAVRYRAGEVTALAPLDVELGGSGVPYEDVKAVGLCKVGDQVATLLWGSDLIVLGHVTEGMRSGTSAVSTTASVTGSLVVTHGLGVTPARVLATAHSNGVISTNVQNFTATQFTLNVMYVDGVARTATNDVCWLAIA